MNYTHFLHFFYPSGYYSKSFCTFAPVKSKKETRIMALAISHVPVLTGEVAERFEREAEYNEKYMRGSQYNPEAFEMVRRVEENTRKYYESLKK